MKIFIVDDASFVRIICRYHIEKSGYQIVGEAYDGGEAVKEIQRLQPDCVIMDLALPTLNGIQVMRKIQQDFSHIRFVVVSALDKDVFEKAAGDLSYEAFLAKPFEGSDLVEILNNINKQGMEKVHG